MSLAESVISQELSSETKSLYVYRVDVLPLNQQLADKVTVSGLGELVTYPVYWLQSSTELSEAILESIAKELLIDPILQRYEISNASNIKVPQLNGEMGKFNWLLERQFLPGVTDNLGKTVEKSIPLLFQDKPIPPVSVSSGQVFWASAVQTNAETLTTQVEYVLFNPLVQRILACPLTEAALNLQRYGFPSVGSMQPKAVEIVPLNLSDAELVCLSQQRSLALTLEEMLVIRSYYEREDIRKHRQEKGLPEWPTDIELEIFAQTWSEHCKHKIFAANIEYTDASDPDYPETININGLFKTYIAGSTEKLREKRPDLLSVFKDNAGVLKWNDDWAVCFKVETHNSPSALEPYGGALTGIVGVNRDILGTGLGAKPLFNTDVFCFAHPDQPYANRPTMLPPESILQGVRKGVEDGGNKSGIPTVNGALFFDSRYRAKPLVFCGTGGLLPLKVNEKEGFEKYTQPGDIIVMAGGRVGKDGIHGATFSSEVLNQDSPISAVQIGDPITQKRMLDFLMEARDADLMTGITDNGAGGLSSSVGEMAEMTNGATIDLEKVPLKYAGLAPYEIVISESQERMTFSTLKFGALQSLARKHDVEVSAIGHFHANGTFDIVQNGKLLASLDLDFLHNGLPKMNLKAEWRKPQPRFIRSQVPPQMGKVLLNLLENPNICSREALIRQYDHEVQGRSVVKPLMGKHQSAPCDAAVLQPVLGQPEGLVVSNGICPQFSDWDAYHMSACAVDEAIRNAVAVGANPNTIALLDNFCWPDPLPSPRNPEATFKLAQLVRSNMALHDMALTFETPLISGKDSMKNDFDDGVLRLSIPPTLLVSAIGKMPDSEKAVSMEFKAPGDHIFLVGKTNLHMGGSQYYQLMGWYSPYAPCVHKKLAKELYDKMYESIQNGWIRSCHDLSEGGLAVALAESALGSIYGLDVHLHEVLEDSPELRWDETLYSESPSRFVISVSPEHVEELRQYFLHLPLLYLGKVTDEPEFRVRLDAEKPPVISLKTAELLKAWRKAPAQCYQEGMTP